MTNITIKIVVIITLVFTIFTVYNVNKNAKAYKKSVNDQKALMKKENCKLIEKIQQNGFFQMISIDIRVTMESFIPLIMRLNNLQIAQRSSK